MPKISVNPFLKKAFLYPTMRCNLNCEMCYSRTSRNLEMSLQEYKHIIKILYNYGVRIFDISGGEPFLSDILLPILEEIKKYSETIIYLVSNGTLINKNEKKVSKVIKFTDRIYISIDSADKDKHDKIRGQKGAFSLAIDGIRNLKKLGFYDIGINFLVMSDNKDSVNEILELSFYENIKYLNLLRLLDVSESDINNQNLSSQEYQDVYTTVQKWIDIKNSKRNTATLSEVKIVLPAFCFKPLMNLRKRNISSDKIKLTLEFDPINGCMAFTDSIIIKSNRCITGCTAMVAHSDFYMENEQYNNSFCENWKNMSKLLNLREEKLRSEEPCSICEHWKICKGGCPVVAQKYYGDFMKMDPTCLKFTYKDD